MSQTTIEKIRQSAPVTTARQAADDAQKTARSLWLAGLGIVATVDAESRAMFDRLVEQGRKIEAPNLDVPVHKAAARVKATGRDLERQIESRVSSALARLGVPTHDDFERLIARIEGLSRKIERQTAS